MPLPATSFRLLPIPQSVPPANSTARPPEYAPRAPFPPMYQSWPQSSPSAKRASQTHSEAAHESHFKPTNTPALRSNLSTPPISVNRTSRAFYPTSNFLSFTSSNVLRKLIDALLAHSAFRAPPNSPPRHPARPRRNRLDQHGH